AAVHLYRVGAWARPAHVVPRDEVDFLNYAPLAFQPKGGLLAAATSRQVVKLFDPETGRLAAAPTHPQPAPAPWLTFSPDGTRPAVARAAGEVAVWDLSRLRAGLAELGLEPGALPGPAARPPAPEVRVDRGARLPERTIAVTRWRGLAFEEDH